MSPAGKISRRPGNAAETLARRAAANDDCSLAEGSVSSRSAQPLPMKSLNPSELGVVERFALRPASSSETAWAAVSVVEVSLEFAMSSILAPPEDAVHESSAVAERRNDRTMVAARAVEIIDDPEPIDAPVRRREHVVDRAAEQRRHVGRP